MRASDEQLRPIRDRGRDILGGSMQVDEWRSPSCTALITVSAAESAGCKVTSTP